MTMSFKVHYQHSVLLIDILIELEVANLGRTTTPSPTVQWMPGRWRPPNDGACVKVNMDGAISRRGTTGAAAAVCRDGLGNYLGASTIVLDGLVDAPSLESHTCNEGLVLARDLNISHAIVASDYMQVVTDIKRGSSSSYAFLLREINERMIDFVKISFCFESRESNFEAHALAKAASSLPSGRHMWLGILPDIICIPLVLNFE